jgi:multidrug transporter EmrE-like cation transporter
MLLLATALSQFSPLVTLLIASGASTFVMAKLKKASVWVDKQQPKVKQVLVVAISLATLAISHFAGLPLPTDFATWDAGAINTILSALIASLGSFGIYNVQKSNSSPVTPPATS